MCLTCACGLPDEDWGNPNNITTETILKATTTKEAKGYTADDIVKELNYGWKHLVSASVKQSIIGKRTEKTVGHKIRLLLTSGLGKKEAHRMALEDK